MDSRQFASEVVNQLQQAGFQALWAGGCVRDQLLGLTPKDYDVATAATPEQVQNVFGNRRTLAIGASFGVITVLGPRGVQPIEVATFRRDVGYSDGRRPDAVEFTDAREDALRRDFTINGMFYDPINDRVLDFVGGQQDLQQQQVRAIGNPHLRIEEDKLRMLRGVRFASTFEFAIETATYRAIGQHAAELHVVSGERIGAEMRRMLTHPNRAVAVQMLRVTNLLAEMLDDGQRLYDDELRWQETLDALKQLKVKDFSAAAAILLAPIIQQEGLDRIVQRWKLSNEERRAIGWATDHWRLLDQADSVPWSQAQPWLIDPNIATGLAVLGAWRPESTGLKFCQARLAWPQSQLDPQPLIGGQQLIQAGIRPGPQFKTVLDEIRQRQLDGQLDTAEQALAFAMERFEQ